MRITFLIAAMLGLARLACASPLIEYFADAAAASSPDRVVNATLNRPVDPAGPGAMTVYGNYGGSTRLGGVYSSGDRLLRDDIVSAVPESILSSYYILFSNCSTTAELLRFDYLIEFVSETGTVFGSSGFTVNLSANPLPAQTSGVLQWPDGSFSSLGVVLPSQFFLRQRLSNAVGIASSNLGVVYGGPQTAGFSQPGIQDLSLGQFVDLGPTNSLMFRIRGNVVPSPSSAAILSTSSLLALRRRR